METPTVIKPIPTWATMDNAARAIFIGKVCVMVCTAGFVFGGVLVEGMIYPESDPPSPTE